MPKLIYASDKLAAAIFEGDEIATLRAALSLAGRLAGDAATRQKIRALRADLTTPAPE